MTFIVLAAAMLAIGSAPAMAALYKWVDSNGVVHYTDTIPPDAVNKGSVELSKQGVQINKTNPATSPEQRRAGQADEERLRQEKKDQQEVLRRDRAVLDSYTSEADIELARNRSLKTVDLALQSASNYLEELEKRRDAMLTKRTNAGDKSSAVSDRELARIDADLERQLALVTRKKAEMTTLIAKYDTDLERWRAAKARAAAAPAASTAADVAQPGKGRK